MSVMKRFNKEQITLGSAAALASLMLVTTLLGGVTVEPVRVPPADERPYKGPPVRSSEFVADGIDEYVKGGRNPFQAQATSTLAIPDLRAPEPPPEPLAMPPFRPAALFEELNRATVDRRYRPLVAGQPTLTDADLPDASVLEELKNLEEPEIAAAPDRRNELTREWDVVHLTNNRPPREGKILAIADGVIILKQKAGTITERISLADVAIDPNERPEKWVEYSRPFADEFKARAQRINVNDVERHLKLARWAREQGMLPEARQEYRAAIGAGRKIRNYGADFLAAARELCDLLLRLADHNALVAHCLEMVQLPIFEKPEFYGRAGDAVRALGVLEAAAELYTRSINESPRYLHGRIALARTLYDRGREADALQTLAPLPTFVTADTPAAVLAEAETVTGLCHLRRARFEPAKAAFDRALARDPAKAEAINGLGVLGSLAGRHKEASDRYTAAIKADQYLTDAWMNVALTYLAAGRIPEAESMLAEAAQRDPASAWPAIGTGLAGLLKGTAAEAQAAFEAALAAEPAHWYAEYALGTLRLAAGELEPAQAHFRSCLRQQYFFLPAYDGAALARLAEGRSLLQQAAAAADADPARSETLRGDAQRAFVQAETLLRTVKQSDSTRTSTHVTLGCILASQGRAEEARNAFNAVDSSPLVAYGLAWIEYRSGSGDPKSRMEAARAAFLNASRIPPPKPAEQVWTTEAAANVQKIADWLSTSIRLDDRFEGRDGERVGAGWLEYERNGVKVTVGNGRLRFAGTQTGGSFEMTAVERNIPKDDFLSLEATLYPANMARAEMGIAVLTARSGNQANAPWTGLWLGFDVTGKLRQQFTSDAQMKGSRLDAGASEVKLPIPDPKAVRLKLEKFEPRPGQKLMKISVWDPATGAWVDLQGQGTPIQEAGGGKEYRVVIWGRAENNQEWSFEADDVRILEKKRQ